MVKTIKLSNKTWRELSKLKNRSPFPPYKLVTFDELICYLIKKVKHIHWKEKILEKQLNARFSPK
jgi:hypothetical protein